MANYATTHNARGHFTGAEPKVPSCHPMEPYYGKGLCKTCWFRQYMKMKYATDPNFRIRVLKKNRESDARHKDRNRIYRNQWKKNNRQRELASKHGYSFSEWLSILTETCEICNKKFEIPRERHFDHDHVHCEKGCKICFRGFLCSSCNRALGFFLENTVSLKNAIDYLERTKNKQKLEV